MSLQPLSPRRKHYAVFLVSPVPNAAPDTRTWWQKVLYWLCGKPAAPVFKPRPYYVSMEDSFKVGDIICTDQGSVVVVEQKIRYRKLFNPKYLGNATKQS